MGNAIYPGDSIRLKASSVTDLNGNSITSPTSIVVSVYDPSGAEQLTNQAATNDGSGNYHYDYQIPSTAVPGTWEYVYVVVNGAYQKTMIGNFTVSEVP